MTRLPEGARRLLRIGNVRGDVAEEVSFHFARTVEELMAEGYSAQGAREEAARRFGDETTYVRELERIDERAARRRRLADVVDALRQVVTSALKSVLRSPALTVGVVLAFALGIGANATMYGIIDRLLLSPPAHIADAANVRRLFVAQYFDFMGERVTDPTLSYPGYLDLTRVRGFAGVAAVSDQELTLGTGAGVQQVPAQLVTGNFFDVLGTKPRLGRFLDESTDRVGGVQEAVISYGMWQRDYAGAPDVLGRTIDFGYGPYLIVGVAPRGFTGMLLSRVDVWLPLRVAGAQIQGTDWEPEPQGRYWQWVETVARLAPGVSAEQAAAEATAVVRAHVDESVSLGRDPEVIVASLIEARAPNASSSTTVAKLLAAVSLLVLLIACVNVTNLLLARTVLQRREMVVRMALGISRRRLIGQIVLEGVLLALLGGAAALAVEHWGGGLVRRTLLPQVAWDDVGASTLMLPIVLALAVLAGALSALVPALQVARRDLADMMRQASGGGITRTTSRLRTSLALSQTALSVILLVGAGLFVRSLHNVGQLDIGIDVDGLVYAVPRTTRGAIPADERPPLFAAAIERLSRLRGVHAVAASSTMPLVRRRTIGLRAEGVDSVRRPPSGGPFIHGVTPGYFAAMGLRIVRGRGIEPTDRAGTPPVTVVSESLAAALWPDEVGLGRCLYIGKPDTDPPCTTVVGVVENASIDGLQDEGVQQYYIPLGQTVTAGQPDFWLMRTDDDPALLRAIRREIQQTDARVRFAEVVPFQDRIAPHTRSWTLGATMFGIFGFLALLVAAIGLYSVLAFDVAQRTREIGIRTALGAKTAAILRMVVHRALLMTGAGLLLGMIAALLLAPRVSDLLFQVPARDPVTFGAVGAVLLLVALAAASLPAWRATRVDPNVTLRME